ncbi:MAG: lipid-binding SYLF domain-containing protein [Bacteroidota bacterium]
MMLSKQQLLHVCFLYGALLFVTAAYPQQEDKLQKIITDAQSTKAAFIAADAKMGPLFENAYGYAIFPNLGKGGVLLGITAGNGVVWQNGEVIGMAKLREVSFGLQLGGQAFSQVIFYDSDEAFSRIKANKVEFRAQAAALADSKSASTDIQMANGIQVFVKSKKGLMGEAAIGGQKFRFKRIKNLPVIKKVDKDKDLVKDYF